MKIQEYENYLRVKARIKIGTIKVGKFRSDRAYVWFALYGENYFGENGKGGWNYKRFDLYLSTYDRMPYIKKIYLKTKKWWDLQDISYNRKYKDTSTEMTSRRLKFTPKTKNLAVKYLTDMDAQLKELNSIKSMIKLLIKKKVMINAKPEKIDKILNKIKDLEMVKSI